MARKFCQSVDISLISKVLLLLIRHQRKILVNSEFTELVRNKEIVKRVRRKLVWKFVWHLLRYVFFNILTCFYADESVMLLFIYRKTSVCCIWSVCKWKMWMWTDLSSIPFREILARSLSSRWQRIWRIRISKLRTLTVWRDSSLKGFQFWPYMREY